MEGPPQVLGRLPLKENVRLRYMEVWKAEVFRISGTEVIRVH